MRSFMFATEIENSYPVISTPNGGSKRIDEMHKCCHYNRFEEDFSLVRELGLDHVRYGPPYYKTHIGPGKYDWEFTDLAFGSLRELGLTPIVDLCHFGVPDWVGDFQNADWPKLFAEYAQAFAQRFLWIRYFLTVNEIFIAATFSAQWGWWNERLSSDRAFVTALHNLSKANVLAMHSILELQPRAIFIQSESSEYFHADKPRVRGRRPHL